MKNNFELKYAHVAPSIWKTLDKIPRTGYVQRGIKDPESVQGHTTSCRDLVVSLVDDLKEFSMDNIVVIVDMLEIHDWPEALIGDRVTCVADKEEEKRLKTEKFKDEYNAMARICNGLGEEGEEIFNLWIRFESGQDPLSVFAKQVDKYQAIIKSFGYQMRGENIRVKEFIDNARGVITHPLFKSKILEIEESIKTYFG